MDESAKDIVLKYCAQIQSGVVKASKYIRLAVDEFMEIECGGTDYYIDWNVVENIYFLGKALKHYEGAYAGKPFILSPWQLWCCAEIFAVKNTSTNTRRYRTAYIKVAKKNGKSFWCCLMMLYAMISDSAAPQGYLVSNSRDQARVCFRMLCALCKQLDPRQKDLKQLRNEIRIRPNDGFIKILSTDNRTIDGVNCAFGIVDEVENAESNDIYENLLSSQASRAEGTILLIGTAGDNLNSWDYEMLNHCKMILDGDVVEPSVFAALYILDDDDDWEDETNWIKCCPNLGESVNYEFMRERANTAKTSSSQFVPIMIKNFNKYMNSPTTWIHREVLDKQKFKFDYEDFKKNRKQYIVFGGIDLSSVSDMSAVSLLFYNQSTNKYYFYSKCYLPETALQDSPNRELYKDWRRRGFLCITNGNVIDYDYILNDVYKWFNDFGVVWFAYDKFGATQFIIEGTEAGVPFEEYGQNMLNFNRPCIELERLLKKGDIYIDYNPATLFCFSNVQLKCDLNGNVKPFKDSVDSKNKIDIVISMLEALGCFLKYYSWE